jgi:deazaflavin-dependent oxidoreductase (nitroreductase family)
VSLLADLGYRLPRRTALHRSVHALAATRPGAWLLSRWLRHLDDVVAWVTRGRTSAAELLAGLPVIDVTTVGRRSGLRRTSHLVPVPYTDTLAILGTNFGRASTPAWVLNLEADPHVTVRYRGIVRDAVARLATPEEQAAVLAESATVYGGYLEYQRRITARRLRIFVLE